MKVVSVCSSDWANFAYNFSESLRSVGVDSYSYCLASHPFGYAKQSTVVAIDQLKKLTEDADFIVVHHSCSELLPHISDRKVIHYAAGTKYRQGYQHLNEEFKNSVATFIALPEFQVYAPKGFHYVVGAVYTGWQNRPPNKRLIVAHYPSNPDVKGTYKIRQLFYQCKNMGIGFYFDVRTERVGYEDQIKRLNDCDIYVEMLAPEQGGKAYGSFGITALEAAALGKIVITQNLHSNDLYFNTYGDYPLELVKDESDLIKAIFHYNGKPMDYVETMQNLTRDWVIRKHSYQATGNRVVKILNEL